MTRKLNMLILFVLAGCLFAPTESADGDCQDMLPMDDFTHDLFEGIWYDVATLQTAGGYFWVKDCFCNWLNASLQNVTNGDTDVDIACNLNEPSGSEFRIIGDLREMRLPGKWDSYQIRDYPPNPCTWTIMYMDENHGITYDCGIVTNEYCVHFVSRTRTIDPEILAQMVEYAENLGLNPRGVELRYVPQDGCTSPN